MPPGPVTRVIKSGPPVTVEEPGLQFPGAHRLTVSLGMSPELGRASKDRERRQGEGVAALPGAAGRLV